jgi:hypothetical protein
MKTVFGARAEDKKCTVENLNEECVICFAEKADVIVLPCRHLSIGIGCVKLYREENKHKECPVCRQSK